MMNLFCRLSLACRSLDLLHPRSLAALVALAFVTGFSLGGCGNDSPSLESGPITVSAAGSQVYAVDFGEVVPGQQRVRSLTLKRASGKPVRHVDIDLLDGDPAFSIVPESRELCQTKLLTERSCELAVTFAPTDGQVVDMMASNFNERTYGDTLRVAAHHESLVELFGTLRLPLGSAQPACGDGLCSEGEDCDACPDDCGACAFCGDDVCDADESCADCSNDCGACRDNLIYWQADTETGEYGTSGWEGPWNSNDAWIEIVSAPVHTGRFAMKLTIDTTGGTKSAVRLPVRRVEIDGEERDLPDEAYYSVWYFLPAGIDIVSWWNVMDWKTAYIRSDGSHWSDPVYSINFGPHNDRSGNYRAWLYGKVGDDGLYNTFPGTGTKASSGDITFEPDTWTHVECYYRWSTNPDGRITCWLDGQLIWNLENVVTQFDPEIDPTKSDLSPLTRQWKVNHYSDGLVPSRVSIFVDDARIAAAPQHVFAN